MNVKRLLRQKAVYWAPTGTTDPSGNEIYETAVEIRCRWEDRNEMFLDPKSGDEVLSRSVIYVDRDTALDGYLFQGGMESILSLDIPTDNPGALKIRRFDRIPDRKNKSKGTVRMAYL